MFFRLISLTVISAFSVISVLTLTSCTGSSSQRAPESRKPPIDRTSAVTIVKKPVYVQRGPFIDYSNMQTSRGVTDWTFHCYPNVDYELESTKTDEQTTATILIKKITLTISLPITIRLGKLAGKNTQDHENGHVQIVKQIYEKAEDVAREACEPAIGVSFEGTGANREDAVADAIDKACQQICRLYRAKTVDVVNAVSKNFDDITSHGRAGITVTEAIRLSYDKYKKEITMQH